MKLVLKRNKFLFNLYELILLIKHSKISNINGWEKHYPVVLQFPITNKCNSNCIMCNIPKMNHNNEMKIDEFSKIIQDPIFKELKSVGINGGEPFLIPNIEMYVKEILKLPKVRSINIITNGFSTNIIIKKLKIIYTMCNKAKVHFSVSISLDGFGEIHDKVRGIHGVFAKTINTVDKIYKNKSLYCDSFSVACTISSKNIDNLIELEEYVNIKGYNMKYRLAIKNKRIGSDKISSNNFIFGNPSLEKSSKEFFYRQFLFSKSIFDKFKYFSFFYFLNSNSPKRLLGCQWQDRGITLDSKGRIYYCAVESKIVGDLRKTNGKRSFLSKDNLEYRSSIIKNKCSLCIHDYSGKPYLKNIYIFIKYLFKERYWCFVYKIKRKVI